MALATELGHALLRAVSVSLGLPPSFFDDRYTRHPTVLFRAFCYPHLPAAVGPGESEWGVGAHTDYGLLTLLRQDDCGGLQVRGRWDGVRGG